MIAIGDVLSATIYAYVLICRRADYTIELTGFAKNGVGALENCQNCGSLITADDQFCGECGQPIEAIKDDFGIAESQPVSIPAAPKQRSLRAIFAIVGVVIMIGVTAYYLVTLNEPAEVVIAESRTEETVADAAADAAELAVKESASFVIEPGQWRFVTKFVAVEKADPNDNSFKLEKRNIGQTTEKTKCITPEIAGNPSEHAFPLHPELACSASSFSMQDGDYRASVYCASLDPDQMDLTGTYTRKSLNLMVKYQVPAEMKHPDSSPPPDLIMSNRISGEYLGACR